MKKGFLFICMICIFIVTATYYTDAQNRNYKWLDTSLTNHERILSLISEMTIEEKARLLMPSMPVDRLDVPGYYLVECLHGVARHGKATVFPQAIGLAATFDTNLVFRVATAISDEARAKYNEGRKIGVKHGLNALSPNINIFRDPRWGRGQETYGEDPYLTGKIGASFVKGLQGDHPKYLKLSACAKHYAVHSGPEPMRHVIDPNPSMKDLYETYLPAFHALVKEGDVKTIMATYNKCLGISCCANEFLLKDVLREQWNFEGLIFSDGGALKDLHTVQNLTENATHTTALTLNKGLDMNLGRTYKMLPEAVDQGLVEESIVDSALYKMLKIQFNLGKFDPFGSTPYDQLGNEVIDCKAHRELARETAGKSIVMLKNKNNVLPLDKDVSGLYVLGNNAFTGEPLIGNYYGISGNMVTVLEGIMNNVDPACMVEYRKGCRLDQDSKTTADWTDVSHRRGEAVIAVMGINNMMEGEEGAAIASQANGDRFKLTLPDNQVDYLKQQRSYGNQPIILILMGGSPIIGKEIYDLADAVLFVWYPGEEGGNAVADVIFGDVNPAGRLPITFPLTEEQLPGFTNYAMKNRTYRYLNEPPLFPFGFGLSYTSFEYSNPEVNKNKIDKGKSIEVKCTITNNGNMAGEEVAQLYLTYPDMPFRMPRYSLKGFKKINLEPGESKQVTFTLKPVDMRLVNMEGKELISEGQYRVTIGGCSPGPARAELDVVKPVEVSFMVD